MFSHHEEFLPEAHIESRGVSFRTVTINALVTAGPRKAPEESFELGEDAAGVCQCGKFTGFWLADGTTSSTAMGGLSTRRLVQELGNQFMVHCNQLATLKGDRCPSEGMIEEVCHVVQRIWHQRFVSYWRELDVTEREALLSRMPATIFGTRHVDWSLVFVCGVIDSTTGMGTIWHCGDCFGYFFCTNGKRIQLDPRLGRLFLRLRVKDLDSDPEVSFVPNEETFSLSQINDIEAFVFMSDGVTKSRIVSRQFDSDQLLFSSFIENVLSLRAMMDDDRGMIYGTVESDIIPNAVDKENMFAPSSSHQDCLQEKAAENDSDTQFSDEESPNESS